MELTTIRNAARRLGVPVTTLHGWVKKANLRVFTLGHSSILIYADVVKLVDEHKRHRIA